jgi:hypothetical protein
MYASGSDEPSASCKASSLQLPLGASITYRHNLCPKHKAEQIGTETLTASLRGQLRSYEKLGGAPPVNKGGRTMADRDFRFERHYELWKEYNTQVSRWAFGTALFAIFLLWKILTPYADLSNQAATQQAALTNLQGELVTIEQGRAALANLASRLEEVRATIERKPWMVERDRLVETLGDLDWAYRTLSSSSPIAVLEDMRQTMSEPGSPIGQQMPLPSRDPPPLARAAATLHLSTDQLTRIASANAFQRLLAEQLERRVQEEADAKVGRIVQQVNDEVIQPLERLLTHDLHPGTELETVRDMVAQISTDMNRWAQQHIGNPTWYQTIQQKDRELNDLTASLRERQANFLRLVQRQQQTLERKQADLAKTEQQIQRQAMVIEKNLGDLDARMQRVLPDWLGDLVSPEDMLQLYPLVLLVLVGVIGFKVGQIRRHYLVVRQNLGLADLSFQDPAFSSLWTLVYRGALGIAATVMVFVGGLILLWWLFESGYGLTATWLAGHPSAAWSPISDWLPAILWLGRLFFAAALIGVSITLLRDRAAMARIPPNALTSLDPADGLELQDGQKSLTAR